MNITLKSILEKQDEDIKILKIKIIEAEQLRRLKGKGVVPDLIFNKLKR